MRKTSGHKGRVKQCAYLTGSTGKQNVEGVQGARRLAASGWLQPRLAVAASTRLPRGGWV